MGKAPAREGEVSRAAGIWRGVRNWCDLPSKLATTCFFLPLNRGSQGEPWVKVAGWQGRFMCHLRNGDASRARKNNPQCRWGAELGQSQATPWAWLEADTEPARG